MTSLPYPYTIRVDAEDKVRGKPIYAADDNRPGLLHAALAVSTIAKGRITDIDTQAASAVHGVRLVLTHKTMGAAKSAGFIMGGGYGFQSLQPMLSPAIAYRGQPIALVAAETLEQAVESAHLVRARYAEEPFGVSLDAPGVEVVHQADTPLKNFIPEIASGDADQALSKAPVKIDAVFKAPPQHQNPMELIASVAEWRGNKLTVHEGTQNAEAVRHGVATALGIAPEQVEVISPYLGGGFGQKNSLQMQTLLAAVAARETGRPVKLVVPRATLFHAASFRPESRHHIRLGAERTGKMLAAIHEVDAQTSRHDLFPGEYTATSSRLYGFGSFRGVERLVRTDVQTPGYMRAPFEHPACFAMECCVDELAYSLGQDPVALRLANDTDTDVATGLPFSSRYLAECLKRGAELFGWTRRSMAPRSMRAKDGSAIGWGVAVGAYPGLTTPAVAHLKADEDGCVVISIGGHEMGQGIRTSLANTVSRKLGVLPEKVRAVIGDTRAAPQHLTAGSWGTASAIPAAEDAADAMLMALAEMSPAGIADRTPAEILKAAGRRTLEVEVQRKPPGQPDEILGRLRAGLPSVAGPVYRSHVTFSYIAHFVEVVIEPGTRRIRVPRVVSVADCGRVISPRTAASQVRGGVVWGIGAALRESSEVDPRYGGFLNADLADYVLPVNADIGSIDVEFIDKPDPVFNRSGVKGLGEVAMTGVAPAIANAVFHATGRRLRDLPVRIDHLL
ncbi:xanthine dehydrogenase family protein molybdopterin-binding subunit [Bradyrhizobium sp. MOS002]|uniref:xanthine dehydrogenase family protein molybdopterin-binding subunit n=1 Tax=Bradyrhizobium sp. MOS002 TaxID=2133947 RepID=UPI000D11FF8F|nr:xanthine dehydrogenase family protein molybdopterin-binding subunit [Bradyrhizobium sp. MOS002]PSO24782.1 xanthine dehydrogenase family protein molybdopterin-binding subunit [Bradyrhizobium sp. MOS002]